MVRKEIAGPIDRAAGERLRAIRTLRGCTQEVLGDAIGVSFQQVQKYEKGTNRLAISTLMAICAKLQCHPMDIIGETDQQPLVISGIVERRDELERRFTAISKIVTSASPFPAEAQQ